MSTAEVEVSHEIEVRSPADGRLVATVPSFSAAQVIATADRLRAAQPAWEALGAQERGKQLLRWLEWILDNERELLELLQAESGKSWGDASIESMASVECINYSARNGAKFLRDRKLRPHSLATATKRLRLVYEPYQLVGVITPWNYPLAMPMLDIPAALVAGCAVLSKPSEVTPLCWREVVRGWDEIGNAPILAVVTGERETGAAVVDTVDYVMFTGSTNVGRQIGIRAAERLIPASLELGGKDPMIVLDDADLDRAAAAATWGGLANSGQTCVAVERIYVEASVHDQFVEKLVDRVSELRQGSDAPGTFSKDLGAMATEAQLNTVRTHMRDAIEKGANVAFQGKADTPEDGLFHPPTVLTGVDHTMQCMTEETFGPTLPVMKVADETEAIRLANDSPYGLTASVFTASQSRGERIARQLDVGAVNVNNVLANLFQMPLPFGGWKHSGIGSRFGGEASVLKYCKQKALVEERVKMPTEIYWYPHGRLRGRISRRSARLLGAPGWSRKLFK